MMAPPLRGQARHVPAPTLKVAAPSLAGLWVLGTHTLRVPWVLLGDMGPRPPFPVEGGPGSLLCGPSPSQPCTHLLGPLSLETGD